MNTNMISSSSGIDKLSSLSSPVISNPNPVTVNATANEDDPTTLALASADNSSTEDDEEEDDVMANSYSSLAKEGSTVNSPESNDHIDPSELIIKRNNEYLMQRCSSLMQRVQGIMQSTAGRHVSQQLQAVLEHPGLNPSKTGGGADYHRGKSSLTSVPLLPPSLTKQDLSELQFSSKLMAKIIRNTMSPQFESNEDSATEGSDTEEDEVVLPDERMMVPGPSVMKKRVPYLPV